MLLKESFSSEVINALKINKLFESVGAKNVLDRAGLSLMLEDSLRSCKMVLSVLVFDGVS